MSKTVFTDTVTVVYAAWLNKVFGLNGHRHLGLDEDGSAPKITIEELDPQLYILLSDLIALKPLVQLLYSEDKPRLPVFGGLGGDGDFNGGGPLSQGQYEFNKFTVPANSTVEVTGGTTRIKVIEDVVIDGLLLGRAVNPYGIGKGWYHTGGNPYGLMSDFLGSGGYEAVLHELDDRTVLRDRGGLGGTCIIIEALGKITVNGSIGCPGGDGNLTQIFSGTPIIGGSGGGSGGTVILQSYSSIQINGTVECTGGRGAAGQGSNAAGGGSGGGGQIYLAAPVINHLPSSLNINAGLPGVSLGAGSLYGGGGGGNGGKGGNSKSAGTAGKILKYTKPRFSPI